LRGLNVESASLEVVGETEVVEVTEPAGDACGRLPQTVDGFHAAVGQLGFHVVQDAFAMTFRGARQIVEGSEARAAEINHPSSRTRSPVAEASRKKFT
jgi:hypothetical protein